ncbi:hypothetical protein ES703_89048 [subsurface metagenome]
MIIHYRDSKELFLTIICILIISLATLTSCTSPAPTPSPTPTPKPTPTPAPTTADDKVIRLYYYGSSALGTDPAALPGVHHIYSATSSDGINFTEDPGVRFSHDTKADL